MTQKRDRILETALELFSSQGYSATSTAKVAQAAQVSEGLIFRHFKNKDGLLAALLEQGQHLIDQHVSVLREIADPRERLSASVSSLFNMAPAERTFWRMVYSLKWQAGYYDESTTKPLRKLLEDSFRELGNEQPKVQAEVMMMMMEGAMTALLLRKPKQLKQVEACILACFDLER